MAITNSFRNAVTSGDVQGLRIMMKDSLLVDPTFDEFEKMNNLARGVTGLFDPHDGREFEINQSLWDDNYMNKLMVQVVGNFSHERVNHLKDVVRHLRPATKRQQPPPSGGGGNTTKRESPKSYKEQKRQDEREGRIINKKVVAGGIAGGVVAGAIVAVVGGSTTAVVVGAATGALAVGLVMAKATSSEG